MKEKLLYRCTSSITANNVANVLDANSIVFRMHDFLCLGKGLSGSICFGRTHNQPSISKMYSVLS